MSVDLLVPRITANDDSVEVAFWYVRDGDFVAKGADLVDFGTSKSIFTLQSECEGFVLTRAPVGRTIKVGEKIATFYRSLAEAEKALTVSSAPPSMESPPFPFSRFSKAAEQYLAERKIDKASFDGMGLVTKRVLLQKLGAGPGAARSEKVGKLKQAEIEALSAGQSGNIISSLTVEFGAAAVFENLKRQNALGGQILPLILYEFAHLLKSWPAFTAYYSQGEIHYFDRIDIGVAMDLGQGLKVPVLRGAGTLMPIEIYEWLTAYAMRYLQNELSVEDMSGGTVTVTDLLGRNIRHFQPLVNREQSIVLGIGGDRSAAGSPLSLTLAFDHRVTNGREAADFLDALRSRLQIYRLSSIP